MNKLWGKSGARFIATVLAVALLMGGFPAAAVEAELTMEEKIVAAAASSAITLGGKQPVIDSCAPVTGDIDYYKVAGHFEGTSNKFVFSFPAKEEWEGRFFQRAYPLEDENEKENTISFGAANGAYTVKANCSSGYALNEAAAKLSREIAAVYYDTSEYIYGYIYGGSGGSFQTIGAVENTQGVWDGSVPFITGLPTSIPNYFFIRAFARFILEDKAELIEQAMNPGGSGNPYSVLDDLEKSVFQEVTDLGVPLRAWEDTTYMLKLNESTDYLLGFGSTIRMIDSSYSSDFWSAEGYLGTEDSELGQAFRDARVDHNGTIESIQYEGDVPISLQLDYAPQDMGRTSFDYTLYQADGTTKVGTIAGSLDEQTKVFTLNAGNSEEILAALSEGAKVNINNSWFLALLAYHRYQVPSDTSYYAWHQFRDTDGNAIYPQRFLNFGAMLAGVISGGAQYDGHFDGKMIMVGNLMDCDAYVWDGDWYSKKVQAYYGDSYDDKYRLWFNDHADHIEFGPRTQRLVQFDGIVERALVELSAWVEDGVEPAQSTRYELNGSQIEVPRTAEERLGVQPVVDLTVENSDIITVNAGETVTFKGSIQMPPDAGKITETEWDFLGNGDFERVSFGQPREHAEVEASYVFDTPGTYYPALRVTSEKDGNTETTFANVENLDRVCVLVSEDSAAFAMDAADHLSVGEIAEAELNVKLDQLSGQYDRFLYQWTSDDDAVLSLVAGNGASEVTLQGASRGEARLSVRIYGLRDGQAIMLGFAEQKVEVGDIVEIEAADTEINPGETLQLHADVAGDDSGLEYVWSISDEQIATLVEDEPGHVTLETGADGIVFATVDVIRMTDGVAREVGSFTKRIIVGDSHGLGRIIGSASDGLSMLADVEVSVEMTTGPAMTVTESVLTGADGTFSLENMQEGQDYTVQFGKAGYWMNEVQGVDVEAFQVTSSENLQVVMEEIERFTVDFDGNGGQLDGILAETQVFMGSKLNMLPADPTRSGYRFVGWYENRTGEGAPVTWDTIVEEDLRVYAVWHKRATHSSDSTVDSGDEDQNASQETAENGDEDELTQQPSEDSQTSKSKFTDIDVNYSWAEQAIKNLEKLGIALGTSETTFSPDQKMKRGDFILLLVRALQFSAQDKNVFSDVHPGDYYYDAVGTAYSLGIVNGIGGNQFDPEGEMSREDMMVIVARALKAGGRSIDSGADTSLSRFEDYNQISGYALESIQLLVGAGIIQGSNGRLNPKAPISRAEMAVVIDRILNQN